MIKKYNLHYFLLLLRKHIPRKTMYSKMHAHE